MQVVRNVKTLKAMAEKGLIKLLPETGTKIKGLYSNKTFPCVYVDDYGDGVHGGFEYKGVKYRLKYFSGCFYPYVAYDI
jgi:hypothetical protein